MSTKRLTFTKSILACLTVLFATFAFVGCTDTADQTAVDEAKSALALVFASGDTATSVTQNLNLPTTVGTVTIAWASNNAAVITNAGVVTRPEANTDVVLTATITLNDASASKEFTVTVLAEPIDPAAALATITITGTALTYNETNQRYTTTADIVLPATALTLAVTWSSSNAAVISAAGVVVRPAYGQTDSTVILTATIGEETRDFTVTVSAITVKPVSLILSEAQTALLLTGGISGTVVTGDLTLAATVGTEGVTVAWASSLPNVIAIDGSVYRPAYGSANANVTLTATLSVGETSVTKEFALVVTCRTTAPELVGTIASTLALGNDHFVRVNGVTVVGKTADSVFIADASGLSVIYMGAVPAKIVVGNVYDMEAYTAIYYNAYQFDGTVAEPVFLAPSTATATTITYAEKTLAEITSTPVPTETTIFSPIAVRVTGKVMISGTGNYNTFIVPENHTGALNKNTAIMVYYKSNKAAISALVGQTITLDIIVYTYRTNDLVWAFDFMGTADDIVVKPMTDEETVAATKEGLPLLFNSPYQANATLTLPTANLGATIVWASSDSALINVTTGAVTIPASGQQTCTLTATITKGEVTDTFTIVLKVGVLPLLSIADAIAQGDGALVRTKGIVTAIDGTAIFIQDASSGIYLYFGSTATWVALMVPGNEIELFGEIDLFNGWWELKNFTAITLVQATTVPAAVVLADIARETVMAQQNKLVSYSGLVLKSKPSTAPSASTSASYTLTNGTNDITLRVNKYNANVVAIAAYLQGLAIGAPVNIVAMPVAVNTNPQFYITSLSQITAGTDADVANADKNALTVAAEALSAGTLTLPLVGAYSSVITWAALPADAIINGTTGLITFPTVAANTNYVLTATITKGTTVLTKEFTVNVRVLTDAEKMAESKAALTLALTANELDVVTLPASGLHGTTLSWVVTSGTAAIADGKISYPLAGAQTVVVTATITLVTTGDPLVETKVFNVVVSAIPLITDLSTVNKKTDGVWNVAEGSAYLQGVVYFINGTNGVFIQDANGNGMYCFNFNAATNGVVVGDEIIVQGTLTTYSSVREMTGTALKKIVDQANTIVTATMTPAEVAAILPTYWEYQAKYVKVTGLTIDRFAGDYVYLNWTSAGDPAVNYYLSFKYVSSYAWWKDAYKQGDVLGEISFLFYNIYSTTTYNILNVTSVAMTDAQKVAYDLSTLPAALELTANYTLATPKYASYTTVIPAISSGLTSYISYAGGVFTVTLPNDVDQVGTITITVSSGEALATKEIAVTVKVMTDAQKLAAALSELPATMTLYQGYTFPTLDFGATYGTIDISAGLTSNLSITTGVISITRPASGITNVTGTLLVHGSLNATTGTKEIAVTIVAYSTELFISEYIEGSSNNKAFEIFNDTGVAVDLSAYAIKVSTNGATTVAYTLALTGTLAAGEVYVVTNASANASIAAVSDVTSNVTFYNGDDFIGLYKGATLIDCVGQLGFDPGSNWSASGVATSEMTLVRIGTDRDTDSSNAYVPNIYWVAYAADTTTYIGSHTMSNIIA